MSAPVKYSHQREAIVDYLKSTKSHPTAEVVYENIRLIIPNISLGTVYRNLNQLADCGRILRLCCDGKNVHYDGFTHPHCHFMCESCGNVSDMDMDFPTDLLNKAKRSKDNNINNVSIVFTGICNTCKSIE
ncbi:MAG: transcriptional repressor [Lachnospiraceae bacterium]|nr:transcriptional repressor [Lachnospiraceae bacterium]